MNTAAVTDLVIGHSVQDHFTPVDIALASFVTGHAGWSEPIAAAALVAGAAARRGHLCLDTEQPDIFDEALPPDFIRLINEGARLIAAHPLFTPERNAALISSGGRLYLGSFHAVEQAIARELTARAATPNPYYTNTRAESVAKLLTASGIRLDTEQLAAVLRSSAASLGIISGGPGTGKTTCALAAVLAHLLLRDSSGMRIVLAAPTGKAAGHLARSMNRSAAALAEIAAQSGPERLHAAIAAIPTEGMTLHRLLGYRPGNGTFARNRSNRIPVDLLVLDETSMVDAPMLARLLAALDEHTMLLLLGDRDQLASVQAGAVMADICAAPAPSAVASRLSILRTSYRYPEGSGIGVLAARINAADGDGVMDTLNAGLPDVRYIPISERRDVATALRQSLDALRSIHGAEHILAHPDLAVEALHLRAGAIKVLTAHRTGDYGTARTNALVMELFGADPDMPIRSGEEIMINANDYTRSLWNGDTGITFFSDTTLTARFYRDEVSDFPIAMLESYERAYAITVHKSQGSEYDHCVILLPPAPSRVITRELLYTAVTRARRSVTIIASEDTIRSGCATKVTRHSGLPARFSAS